MNKFTRIFTLLAIITPAAQVVAQNVEFVDLGLPSGALWADRNVGATSEEETGSYISWGETAAKETYSWATYKWCDGTQSVMTKYVINENYGVVDNKTILDAEDDIAATAENVGSPTVEDFKELMDSENCTWTLETINGRKGARVTGKNGNSIFLPAAGYMMNRLSLNNSAGCYWTNGLYTDQDKYYYNANVLRFGISRNGGISLSAGDRNGLGFASRYYGCSIRPVKHANASGGIGDVEPEENATIVKIYNITGTELPEPAKGLNIVVYSDGTVRKIMAQ